MKIINEYISTSYARFRLSSNITPFREILIDGFILNIISDGFTIIDDIVFEVNKILHISLAENKRTCYKKD